MSAEKQGSDASNKDSSFDPNCDGAPASSVNVSEQGTSQQTSDKKEVSPSQKAKTDDESKETPGTAGTFGNVQPRFSKIAGSVNNGFSEPAEEHRSAPALFSVYQQNQPNTSADCSSEGSDENNQQGSAHNQPSTSGGYSSGYPPEPVSTPRENFAYGQPRTCSPYSSGYHPGSVRTAPIENPNNQFVTNPDHSSGYPSTSGKNYRRRSGRNQPSSSSEPRSAERFGNSGSAISRRPRPIIRHAYLQNHVPARVDLQTPVDIFVDSLDYMLFQYTFSHVQTNEEDSDSQTLNARRWELAILAALSFIFTGEVIPKLLCSDDQRKELVREYLKLSPLPRRAAPIISQLSVIVDRANRNDRCSCQLFFSFHSLIILIGSLRNELRTRFFSESINDETLLKKVVQEIIFSFEEKCVDDMGQANVANEQAESEKRKQAVEDLSQQPLREVLDEGFGSVHFWQDFPTPDAVEQLIGNIEGEKNKDVNTNEPLKKQDDDNNKRLHVLPRGDDPIVQESPYNDHWLSEVFSDIAPYLNRMTNGEEQDQVNVPRATDQQMPPSINDMLNGLKNRFSKISAKKEKEVDVQEQQAMSSIAKIICELIMTERSIQKRIFSAWKEDSKAVIENLLENFTEAGQSSFRKLVDIFGILRLHDRYRIDAAIEGEKNYELLRTETNPDRAMHLIIAILRSKRIDLVFSYPIPRRVTAKQLNGVYKCWISGRKYHLNVSLQSMNIIRPMRIIDETSFQRLEDNTPSIAVLAVECNSRKRDRSIYIRIDSGLINETEPMWSNLFDIANKVFHERRPSAKKLKF